MVFIMVGLGDGDHGNLFVSILNGIVSPYLLNYLHQITYFSEQESDLTALSSHAML